MNPPTLLYVEDDPLGVEIMQMLLQTTLGIGTDRLKVFEDSQDFLVRLRALPQKPDLILLDIHVEPVDGFSMLELLRAEPDYASTRVVALTASVMSDEIARLKMHGFDGAIGKPLSVMTFPQLLQRLLNGESVWHVA